jgi:hypothetical protein
MVSSTRVSLYHAATIPRDVVRFDAELLPTNRPMLRLLDRLEAFLPRLSRHSGSSITYAVDFSAAGRA